MRKSIYFSAALMLLNTPVSAEGCPEFFRFVDFGLETPDGPIRGGPTYRAESFEGQALLIRDLTLCQDARDLATDGHGNPIPLVTSVNYDPETTGLDLKDLRLTVLQDIAPVAEENAAQHRARLENQSAVITRGPDYLCASLPEPEGISCQFVSPFGGNLPLVVHCAGLDCRIPVFALNEKVAAVASWQLAGPSPRDQEAAVLEMAEKLAQVHEFLAPLSSWKPNFSRLDP